MGILGKVIGAGASLIGAGAEALGKKIENVFLERERKNLEYLSKFPYSHKYIIREVKEKLDEMDFANTLSLDKDFFAVYDSENSPKYVTLPVNKKEYCITSLDRTPIAKITVHKSLLGSQPKSCTIVLDGYEFELRISGSADNRRFSVTGCDYRIDTNDTGKKFKGYKKRVKAAQFQIDKVPSDLGAKWGEYIVGCNDPENIVLTICTGIGLALLLVESANLLE